MDANSDTARFATLELDGQRNDTLMPIEFSGEEELSRLYAYKLDVTSEALSIEPGQLLGHAIALTLPGLRDDAEPRRFEGIVASFSPGLSSLRGFRRYRIEIVPVLWRATLNARCRAFLNMPAIAIVQQVLKEYGLQAELRGAGTPTRPVREYCLQYCESDFDFISRLLADEGLFFYFPLDHRNQKLVLVDGLNGDFPLGRGEVTLDPDGDVTGWSQTLRTVPRSATYAGYDFVEASVSGETVPAKGGVVAAGKGTVEVYPSTVVDTPRQDLAGMHMERLERDHETFEGSCPHVGCAPGGRFLVGGDAAAGAGRTMMLTSVVHRVTSSSGTSGDGGEPAYRNTFSCVPVETTYRPPLHTRRPRILGVQTATVSSDPDKYGRVKVRFHWGGEVESWWVRVAMPWADGESGMQFLPRPGSEVVVHFLDGDPERPIIVGAVHNGRKMPIYPLPTHKLRSGIRGIGSADPANEIQFEDTGGSECLTVIAAKDCKRTVMNQDSLTVRRGDRTVTLESGNLAISIERGSQTVKVALGSSSTEAMQSIELKVGANSITIDQQGITLSGMTVKIEGNMMASLKAAMTTVEGSGMLTVKGGIAMIN